MTNKLVYTKSSIGISSFLYIIYCLFYISGLTSDTHNYVIVSLYSIWILSALIEDRKAFYYSILNKSNLLLFSFLFFFFFFSIFNGEIWYTITYMIKFLMLFGCFIPTLYYLHRSKIKEILFISISSIIIWMFFSLSAILFYNANPSAARILAADFYAYENIAIGGGYAIAFGSAILSVYLLEILLQNKFRKFVSISIIVIICILVLLITKTESTTTFIACILGFVYVLVKKFFFKRNLSLLRKLIYLVILFITLLFTFVNINNIGNLISNNTTNTEQLFNRRFNRIGEKLKYYGTGEKIDNYVDERWSYVEQSFNTFYDNPIIGVGYKFGFNYSKMEENGVGMHSQIIDSLAQYGIVGCFILFYFFIYTLYKLNLKYPFNSYIVTLLLMTFINPFIYFHGFFVLFTLIPLVNWVNKSKNNMV